MSKRTLTPSEYHVTEQRYSLIGFASSIVILIVGLQWFDAMPETFFGKAAIGVGLVIFGAIGVGVANALMGSRYEKVERDPDAYLD